MAVKEFRFNGLSKTGQPVRGTVFAPTRRAAQKKIASMSEKHGFSPRDLQERRVYLYKVRHSSGKIVTGEQKAFSEEEVSSALKKLGVEVVRVEKKLLNYQPPPPRNDVIMFVRLAANLLSDKLPFDEILNLLISDVGSKSLRQVIRDLSADLKGGMDAQQAYMKHQHMLGKFTAYMLGIASKSGNMSEIYEATAKFLERQNEFNKSVRSALIMPMFTILVLIAVLVWYVMSIFPQTAGLFRSLKMELPPLTAWTMDASDWLNAHYGWILLAAGVIIGGFAWWARTPKGQFEIHKRLIKLPVIGALLHKLNIEIFARVFAILYSGAGENIGVIKIASEATGNAYMEHQIKTVTIPMLVAQGSDLVRAMEASGVFTPLAIARFRTGAETGNVKKSAQQIADFYQKETELKLKAAVDTIQLVVTIFIFIALIYLTLISSEIALVQPSMQDMMR